LNPEFAETADEKAAREEEEENLPEEERKKKKKEKAEKKWKESIEQLKKDAGEQQQVNWDKIVDNFFENYKAGNDSNLGDAVAVFEELSKDINDSAMLYNEAGEYFKKLNEYLANPKLMDDNKSKEENKAAKEQKDKNAKEKVGGKTAREINEDLFSGDLNIGDIEDYLALDDKENPKVALTKEEIKKAEEIRKKGARLKQHIQDNLGDNPTPEEQVAAEVASGMVDDAVLSSDSSGDLNLDNPTLKDLDIEQLPGNMTDEQLGALADDVRNVIQEAFDDTQEDEDVDDSLPDASTDTNEGMPDMPAAGDDFSDDNSTPDLPTADEEVGDDPVTPSDPVIVNPDVSEEDTDNSDIPVPESPLTEDALNTVIEAMKNLYESPSTAGGWRTCTTRHPYGSTFGTYHENYAKDHFGKDSIQYRRSKAIWEYLNSVGAFDRQDNASGDRLKSGDVVHFMVKNFAQEMYGKDFGECNVE
jgi:hypothetical protein